MGKMLPGATTASPESVRNRCAGRDAPEERDWFSYPFVAELQHVTKRYGERVVIDDFSCVIQRGDKLGLIGPNGCGKTTLLKLILGELTPDSGTVRAGTRLAVAYFDQFRSQLDE